MVDSPYELVSRISESSTDSDAKRLEILSPCVIYNLSGLSGLQAVWKGRFVSFVSGSIQLGNFRSILEWKAAVLKFLHENCFWVCKLSMSYICSMGLVYLPTFTINLSQM